MAQGGSAFRLQARAPTRFPDFLIASCALAAFNEDSKLSTSPALEPQLLEGYPDVAEIFRRAADESHIRTGRHISRNQTRSICRSLSRSTVAAPSVDASNQVPTPGHYLPREMEIYLGVRLSARAGLRVCHWRIGKALAGDVSGFFAGVAWSLTVY